MDGWNFTKFVSATIPSHMFGAIGLIGKIDNPYLATTLIRAPIFEWYII